MSSHLSKTVSGDKIDRGDSARVWIARFLWRYVPGANIPEALSALSASLWVVIIGSDMARGISHSSD